MLVLAAFVCGAAAILFNYDVPWTGALILLVAAMAWEARQYKRPAATRSHADVVVPLVRSDREYCLVLRPFGHDGEMIVPRGMHKNRIGLGNTTLEQLVARVARSTLQLETFAIVDQGVLLAPPGLTWVRVPHTEWQMVARQLIGRAHSIVLLVSGREVIRDGFAWEIEQIVRLGVEERVVLVLPPSDQDAKVHEEARRQAHRLVAFLYGISWSDGPTAPHFQTPLEVFPESTIVVKIEAAGPQCCFVEGQGAPRRVRIRPGTYDETYVGCLSEALRSTARMLFGTTFRQRYPRL